MVAKANSWVHVCRLLATLVYYLSSPFMDSPNDGCASSGSPQALSTRLKNIYQRGEDGNRELQSQDEKLNIGY